MTIEEITESLEQNYKRWGTEHTDEIDTVSINPTITERIVHFIEEAIRHPKSTTGEPRLAVQSALKLTALSNFRFGLLVGILLHAPSAIEDRTPETLLLPDSDHAPCPECLGTGAVCFSCGFAQSDCSCRIGYSPVVCAVCDGKGEI